MYRYISSLVFSFVIVGCAGSGVNSGSGTANGGDVKTTISNFPCMKISKLEIGCADQGAQQQDSKSSNQGTTTTGANQLQSGTACGAAAMKMTCPSIAISGTDCRRCQ